MKQFVLPVVLATALVHTPRSAAQRFDVASVRINRSGSTGGEGRTDESITSTPAGLIMRNVTLLSCAKLAYGMRDFQITGAPGWFSSERYDISAKATGPVADVELRKMLQALLADRFQLRVREESKQLPVYTLIEAKSNSRLKPTTSAWEPGAMHPGDGALEFRNTSMAQLAEQLAKRPLIVDRPVVDETGLTGGYDFSLKFANNAAELKGALEDVDRGTGQSIAGVLLEQLGLKLEPEKASLPILVVERAVENPGEN